MTLPTGRRVPLVIDTDTASDDCFALLLALLDPRADLRAITIAQGNVSFDQQVHNAFLTLEVAGRVGEVPVHLGEREALAGGWIGAEDVHGDGVGGQRRTNDAQADPEHAVDALLRLTREAPGELSIVAIGPLTNLARAVERDAGFAGRVRELIVMGGSLDGVGNITPAAEYNIYADPEAAAAVVGAGFPLLRFITWSPVTLRDAIFDAGRVEQIRALGTGLSDFFVRANQAPFDFDTSHGVGGSTHPDTLSVLAAFDPRIVREERPFALGVVLEGERRGATDFEMADDASAANCTAVTVADGERLFATMLGILAGED
ncbi:nucleoside hydrolase [Demequina mangrovi]|uniref:Purine nucleosidase n=1 Tax=Demequina mangrovi TaxID=1043493 RepID=A0A1H7AC72_9MICO|nr:nucleoside hydrolase [Demequina mangrovi]SEJ62536.1 purine nucleosidase [Demequina mangrovi]